MTAAASVPAPLRIPVVLARAIGRQLLRPARPVVAAAGSAVAVAVLAGCAGGSDEAAAREVLASAEAVATSTTSGLAAPSAAQSVTVVEVAAGDTLVVEGEPGAVLDGQPGQLGQVEIRLLQVDSPNPGGADGEAECLAEEATAFTAGLAPPGSTVLLAADEEPRDEDGRLLVYAWTEDGAFVNEGIVRNGLAYVVLFPPNDEHISVMTAAETAARDARLGVWGDC